jgi:hypothetical protein
MEPFNASAFPFMPVKLDLLQEIGFLLLAIIIFIEFSKNQQKNNNFLHPESVDQRKINFR